MGCQWFKTQYPGVRYREHKERKHSGRPDRYYTIYYKLNGKTKEEGLGWASQGWNPQQASYTLAALKKAQKTGEGAVTLEERRIQAEESKKDEARRKAQEEREGLTFSEAASRYIEWAKRNKKTWGDDETRLRLHVLPHLGVYPMVKIGIPEMELLKTRCQEKRQAPATVVQCLAITRAVFNFAINQRLYEGSNPVKGVRLPKADNKRIRFLSKEEAQLLLDTAASYSMELHDMCLICLFTGMRAGEMMGLTWSHIDFEHGIITIRDGKNGDSRQSFMTQNLKEMLFRRKAASTSIPTGLVFPSRTGKQRKKVSKHFDYLVNLKLRLNEGVNDHRQRVVFHTLRHTFASWLAIQGETLLTIKELMGHKTVQMTMRYAHLIPDQKRKAVERLTLEHTVSTATA